MNKVIIPLMAVPLLAGIAGAVAPRWLVSALLGASATILYLLLYAPAHSASARLLLLERRAEQDD